MNQPIVPGASSVSTKPNGAPAGGNGAVAGLTPPAAAPDLAAQLAAAQKERDEYKTKIDAADKKLRIHAIEEMKFRDEKKGIGAKLSEHSQFDAAFKAAGLTAADLRSFKVNPWPVLEKVLGPDYYDKLVEHRLNGGTITAKEAAAMVERANADLLEGLEKKQQTQQTEAQKKFDAQRDAARLELTNDATVFLDKSWADYPIFDGYQKPAVAKAIADHQEREYKKSGKVITTKEAADALEEAEIGLAKRVASIPKYATQLTEHLKPATVPPVGGSRSASGSTQSERRTLSNDLTVSTPQAKRTKLTDEERMARIMALDLSKS